MRRQENNQDKLRDNTDRYAKPSEKVILKEHANELAKLIYDAFMELENLEEGQDNANHTKHNQPHQN